jgi:hypothetical protein
MGAPSRKPSVGVGGNTEHGAKANMNPLHWKREHQIALLGAAIVVARIGIFAGARQLEPSATYWLWLGL